MPSSAPNWTTEKAYLTRDSWHWRREVETVTWWPSATHITETSSAAPTTRDEWTCTCGQGNWARRTHCYECGIPRSRPSCRNSPEHGHGNTNGTKDPNSSDQLAETGVAKQNTQAKSSAGEPAPLHHPRNSTDEHIRGTEHQD